MENNSFTTMPTELYEILMEKRNQLTIALLALDIAIDLSVAISTTCPADTGSCIRGHESNCEEYIEATCWKEYCLEKAEEGGGECKG